MFESIDQSAGMHPLRVSGLWRILCLASVALGAPAAQAQCTSLVVKAPSMVINPTTNSGEVLVEVRNAGRACKAYLRIGDFKAVSSGQNLGAKVVLSDPADAEGAPIKEVALAAGESTFVKATANGVWEAGEVVAEVFDRSVKVEELEAAKIVFPFKVGLDVANPGIPELTIEKGRRNHIPLKNEDGLTYPVTWQLVVSGIGVSGANPVVLPPNGSRADPFDAPEGWFRNSAVAFFKDEEVDGRVTLAFAATGAFGGSFPVKSIPVKIRLKYMSQNIQDVVSYGWIVVWLLIGGGFSLVLNFGVPNFFKVLAMKEKASDLGRRISGISTDVDSSLRVMLRVERQLLKTTLARRSIFSPDLGDVIAAFSEGLASLESRVKLVERLDNHRRTFNHHASHGWAPTKCWEVDEILQQAADALKQETITKEQLEEAEKCLVRAGELLKNRGQPDPDFEERLKETAEALEKELEDICKDPKVKTLKEEFCGRFGGMGKALKDAKGGGFSPRDYDRIDDQLCRMEVMRDYLSLIAHTTDIEVKDMLLRLREQLQSRLVGHNWMNLNYADLLVHQGKEDIYSEDLETALAYDHSRSIEIDRMTVQRFDALEISMRFARPDYSLSAARDEMTCHWDFGDSLTEKGWTVWHYYADKKWFKNPEEYTITATFFDRDGRPVGQGLKVTKPVKVWKQPLDLFKRRVLAESARTLLALFVAVVALVSGAKGQIAELGLIPATMTIFGMGFAADTIKNILTKA